MATQTLSIILLSLTLLFGLATLAYLFFRKGKPTLLILVVEKIGTPAKNSRLKEEWVSVKSLEKTLNTLCKKGFSFVSLADLKEGHKLPPKPVLLAFIGGYQTVFTDIFPLLKTCRIKASVFLSPSFVDTYNAWQSPEDEPWQKMLTAKQLKTLQTSRLISFGVLPLNGKPSADQTAEEACFELTESAFRLKNLLGLKAEAYAWNDTEKENLSAIQNRSEMPILSFQKGINPLPEKKVFKTLRLGKNPLFTRFQIFKQR